MEHDGSPRCLNWQRGLNSGELAGTTVADNVSDWYGAVPPLPWSPLTWKVFNGVKDRDSVHNEVTNSLVSLLEIWSFCRISAVFCLFIFFHFARLTDSLEWKMARILIKSWRILDTIGYWQIRRIQNAGTREISVIFLKIFRIYSSNVIECNSSL